MTDSSKPDMRAKLEATKCETCEGKGWHWLENERGVAVGCEPCEGAGWFGAARWHCEFSTPKNVCNPDHTGGGHFGCGWFVPITAKLRDKSDLCRNAAEHEWVKATADRRGEGLQCGRCGVTEAEFEESSDIIVIRRGEDGEWPAELRKVVADSINEGNAEPLWESDLLASQVLDALSDSLAKPDKS